MNEKLLSIIEGYKAKSGDEQNFMDKHVDNISVFDGPGVEEIRRASDAVSFINRDPMKGYNPGQDEEVYEQFASEIEEAIQEFLEEADEEERQALEELFSTEEGYDEFVAMLMEEDDEDEDDDSEEDDDDTEEMDDDSEEDGDIEVNPKMKKEKKQ